MHSLMRPARHTVLALGLSVLAANAGAADFYIGLGLGGGDVDASAREFTASPDVVDDSAGESVLVSELFLGFQFEGGLQVELAQDDYDTFGFPLGPLFLGDVDYDATRLNLGYAPEPNGRFGFVGKLGLAFWDVELTESPFLNPGLEDRASRDGTDLYGYIGAQYRVSNNFRLGAGYDFTNADAADVRSFKINFRWVFD